MRHAKRHWLEIQARKAVELAATNEDEIFGAKYRLGKLSSPSLESLCDWREHELKETAKRLVLAELLHREIVKRGGSV